MVQSVSITEAITTMGEAHTKLGVYQTESDLFFPEWYDGLPGLSAVEQERIDQLKRQCIYQMESGRLIEETVKMVVLSPLLNLAGFYDPPFRFRTEVPVKFELEEEEETLQGRIDALVFQDQFWAVVVEAKQTSLNERLAIPQTLAYMIANPYPDRPTYGLITNGTNFAFLKLIQPEYELSRVFSLLPRRNELVDVLKILKRIGTIALNN